MSPYPPLPSCSLCVHNEVFGYHACKRRTGAASGGPLLYFAPMVKVKCEDVAHSGLLGNTSLRASCNMSFKVQFNIVYL